MTREQFISRVEASQKAFRRFLVALCCGDSALADDVAQEAYIKAYLSFPELRDPERFDGWLRRIGYTSFLNHKRTSRIGFGAFDEAIDVVADDSADSSFRYQALYMALNSLSPQERSSILLHYMENYSVKEISEIQSVSQDAVRQHLSRGRRHLRRLLKD